MSTNTNNYASVGKFSYGSGNVYDYATLGTSSNDPSSTMMCQNPNDPTYVTFIKARNANLLNPNQNTTSGYYYNISSAYGNFPANYQAPRSCTGTFDDDALPKSMTGGPGVTPSGAMAAAGMAAVPGMSMGMPTSK